MTYALETQIENLRAEVNRLNNVIGERDMQLAEAREGKYPCNDCGVLRTKAEGGTIFTVCDECWDKHYKRRGNHE